MGLNPPPPPPAPSLRATRRIPEFGSVILGLGLGLALMRLLLSHPEPGFGRVETLRYVAYGAIATMPGLFALLAFRSRPALFLAAALIAAALPLLMGSILGFAFWVPAAMALGAYERHEGETRGVLADPVIALFSSALAAAAVVATIVHQDPYCSTGRNFSACASDIVTTAEAAVSLGFVGLSPRGMVPVTAAP